MVDALIRLAPFIAAVGAAFLAAKVYTLGFAGALALVFSPAILIAAGIAAVLLVLDDLIVAFQGGKSVIRNFFLEFFGFDIKPLLVGIVEGFKGVLETLKNFGAGVFDSWVEIFSGIGDILAGNFSDGFDKIGEGFSDMVDTWGDLFRSVFSGIFDWAKNAVINIVPDWVLDIIGPDSSGSPSASPGGSQALQPGGGRANNVGQYDSIEQTVIMDIRTADPEKAGKAASDGLQRQLEDARNQTRGRGGS